MLCGIASLSHTNGQALGKEFSVCGTPRIMTQHLSAVVHKQLTPFATGELICQSLANERDEGTGRPVSFFACIPAQSHCQALPCSIAHTAHKDIATSKEKGLKQGLEY